jgi:shikimate kinase
MKIVLLGLPGSGKSFWGKKLAEKLDFVFYDDDLELFKIHNLDTVKLLEKYGNEKFLELEEKVFLKGFENDNLVLSPGGSIIYSEKLLEKVKNECIFIYLESDLDVVLERIKKQPRGIVYIDKYNGDYNTLFKDRVVLYKKYANFVVDANKEEKIVLEETLNFLEN